MNRAARGAFAFILVLSGCAIEKRVPVDEAMFDFPYIEFEDHEFEAIEVKGWSIELVPGRLNDSQSGEADEAQPDFVLTSTNFVYIGRMYASLMSGKQVDCRALETLAWVVTFEGEDRVLTIHSDGVQARLSDGRCLSTTIHTMDVLD